MAEPHLQLVAKYSFSAKKGLRREAEPPNTSRLLNQFAFTALEERAEGLELEEPTVALVQQQSPTITCPMEGIVGLLGVLDRGADGGVVVGIEGVKSACRKKLRGRLLVANEALHATKRSLSGALSQNLVAEEQSPAPPHAENLGHDEDRIKRLKEVALVAGRRTSTPSRRGPRPGSAPRSRTKMRCGGPPSGRNHRGNRRRRQRS